MKRLTIVLLLGFLCAGLGAHADEAAGFMGKWKVTMDIQGREIVSTLHIKKDEAGAPAGTWESRRGKNDLENVKIADGNLSFRRTMERQGQSFSIDSTAKLVDGKLAGTMSTPRGERPFTAVRPKPVEEQGDRPGPPGGGGGPPTPERMLQRMDTNGDGKVQESEAPERMQQFFSMIDADGDGGLDKAELQTMLDNRPQR